MAETSLNVVIRGKDEFSKTAKGVMSSLSGMDKAAKGLGKTLSAIGTGISMGAGIAGFNGLVSAIDRVVTSIPDAISASVTWGNTIDDLRDATGSATVAASQFAGAMQYTTGSFEGLGPKLREVTQELFRNEAGFKALGIETRNAQGAQLDTISIIENTRRVFATLPAGAEKAALAIQLFGRNALSMIDYLSLSDEQVGQLNAQLERMGYTIADTAPFEAAQRELNLWDMAWQGLSNSLTTTVLPAIRQVVASITEAVVTYGPQIKAVLADIINYISGVASGLLGLPVTPFQQQMDALATSTGGTVLSFKDWATVYGKVIPEVKAGTSAVDALSAAFDRQTAALDRNIERVKALDSASQTLYDRQMKTLTAGIDADIAALDSGEKQLAIARQRKQYEEDIADARTRLAKASKRQDDGLFDFEGIKAAQRALDEAIAARDEYERGLKVQDRRDDLESTKKYVESIADLEQNATNRTALANTLANRKKVLESRLAAQTAAGDEAAASQTRIQIAAIEAAQIRNNDRMRTADKVAGYEEEKKKIEEVKKAALDASRTTSDDTKTKLAELQKEYDTYKTGVLAKLVEVKNGLIEVNDTARGRKGDVKGAGGVSPIAQAFIDGKEAAEGFRAKLEEVFGWISQVVDKAGGLNGIFEQVRSGVAWFQEHQAAVGWAVLGLGAVTGNVALALLGAALIGTGGNSKNLSQTLGIDWPWNSQPSGPDVKYPLVERAAGGPVSSGRPYVVGERGPELFVPGTAGHIVPSGGYGGTIVVPVYLDGRVIAEVVDERFGRRL